MLVVPVDVAGLCLGEDDAQQATSRFAGATAVYQEQATEAHGAFLGDNVSRGLDDQPWDQLESGVHLHWSLPDGLTRGGGRGAELDFPAAPNRWLVTRIVISGGSPVTRSWLIESDALSADPPPAGVSSVTLPVRPSAQLPQGFGYLGRSHDVTGGWSALRATGGPAITEASGTPLTAVCNGEVGFAAYYPSCRGVFGFRDALDDLAPQAAEPAQLAYSVIGWYDDPPADPVQPGATPEQLQTARGWTFTPARPAPSGSVYAGALQGIGWSPHIPYVQGQPVQQPVSASAAIGNTAAEALAVYFTARNGPGVPLFETLLDALQAGLIEAFQQSAADGLTQLQERLHRAAVRRDRRGNRVLDCRRGRHRPRPRRADRPAGPARGRPRPAQRAARAGRSVRLPCGLVPLAAFRRLVPDLHERPRPAQRRLRCRAGALQRLGGPGRDELRPRRRGQRSVRQGNRPARPGHAAAGRASRPVRPPADPAVLITGEAVSFPARYGGDGRFTTGGHLACRASGQLVTAVTVGTTTLAASSLTGIAAPAGLPGADLLTALLREACLLSTALLASRTGQDPAALKDALERALADKPQDTWTITGTPPSPVGVHWQPAGQWLPVFASWNVSYLPLQPTQADGRPAGYDSSVITANFRLDPDAGGTLSYAQAGGPGSITVDPATASFPQHYAGAGNLTPTPAQTLTQALTSYPGTHTDRTLSVVLAELTAGTGFLVAPLNGLTDALLMRQRGVQLGVQVPDDSPYQQLTQDVAPIIGDAPQAGGPEFNGHFNPLRAGYLKLSLTLVDVFGQKRAVQFPPEFPQLICAQSMTTVADGKPVPSVAYLPPRIAQPSRLAFRWLAADGTGAEQMTGNPAVSPVCGWLLPSDT